MVETTFKDSNLEIFQFQSKNILNNFTIKNRNTLQVWLNFLRLPSDKELGKYFEEFYEQS